MSILVIPHNIKDGVVKSNFEYTIEALIEKAVLKIADNDVAEEKKLLLHNLQGKKNSVIYYDPLDYIAGILRDAASKSSGYRAHMRIDAGNIEINVSGKDGIFSEDGLDLNDYPAKGALEVVEIIKRLCARDMALYQLMLEGYLMPVVNAGIGDNKFERLSFDVKCNNGNRPFYVNREKLVVDRFVVLKA